MIIVKIRGGIGNQLFQYALGRTLAVKYNTNLILDTSWYCGADRKFALDELNTVYKSKISNRFILSIIIFLLKPRVIKDMDSFEKIEIKSKESAVLDGWWGSYPKYFSETEIFALKKEITLKHPSKKFLDYSQKIGGDNSIAVHVRRGDFLRHQEKYVVQDKSYYINAIQKLISEEGLQKPRVSVFSEKTHGGIEWCKENIKIDGVKIEILEDSGISDLEELFLISMAKYNIISNSTFSWWAAFLNKNQNKIIVAPAEWQKDDSINKQVVSDLVSPTWKII